MLVERPPSPGTLEQESYDSYLDGGRSTPHYMAPLKSRAKSASLVPTIDMFSVVKKKKVNLWETAGLRKEPPSFQRTVLPSYPLSTDELRQLQKDYALKLSRLNVSAHPSLTSKPKVKISHYRVTVPSQAAAVAAAHAAGADPAAPRTQKSSGVFLTQLLKTDDDEQAKLAFESLKELYTSKRAASAKEAASRDSSARKSKPKARKQKSAKQT